MSKVFDITDQDTILIKDGRIMAKEYHTYAVQ